MFFRTASVPLAHDHERVARSNLRAETLAVRKRSYFFFSTVLRISS